MSGHGIERDTYINADEKTTKALTFDLLDNLYDKVEGLEKRKKRDTVTSSLYGFLGGFVAMTAYYIRKFF